MIIYQKLIKFLRKRKRSFTIKNKLNHVAFIMDGNGRWGKKKNKNEIQDTQSSNCKKIVEASTKLKIPTVTFLFSQQKTGKDQKQR